MDATKMSRSRRSEAGQEQGRPLRAEATGMRPEAVRALESDLRRRLRGEVRFDAGGRALYAADASNYRQVPIGVVFPRADEDVEEAISICRVHGAPVLPRGGGTSLAGQCTNVALVFDFSRHMNRVIEIDPDGRLARVEPGTVLDDLRRAARRYGLTFGPDPATHTHCTLGGMIGNNSCGVHSVMSAFDGPGPRTSDNVRELDVLTSDGTRLRVGETAEAGIDQIVRLGGRAGEIHDRLRSLRDRLAPAINRQFPRLPRRVSGYNLPDLLPERSFNLARALTGSEGTCVTILEATLSLVPEPPARTLVVLGYPDVFAAADHVTEIMEFRPIGCEGMDDLLIGYMRRKGLHPEEVELLPEGKGWLLVEFGGQSQEEADKVARRVMEAVATGPGAPTSRLFNTPEGAEKVWSIRESGLGATAFVPGHDDTWPGWEDAAVPPDRLPSYLRDFRELLERYGYHASLYGHFGQGCVHTRIPFDLDSSEGVDRYLAFTDEAGDLVVRHGGSLSGEHGDGQARADLLSKLFSPEIIDGFREFKSIWDPEWRMNPGKVVNPFPRDSNLRLRTTQVAVEPATHFKFPDDEGSFARATLRCVGVGKCRREGGGTMCPSYMVTREEEHTTRGRAHLLFEMLRGEVVTTGWESEAVKESLDLCLSCKGCKGDCPVNVDIATYKAEFLSHYYEKRWRPRHAWAFGFVHEWAAVASLFPEVANFFARTPGLSALAKLAAGASQERTLPAFAPRTFRSWFAERPAHRANGRSRVILWVDTFNNHFHPATLAAAVEVLEAAGSEVVLPPGGLCCGRPLYDYGFLKHARRRLRGVLETLRDDIRAGTPVVGLEPSCLSVFRDELLGLFPEDDDARRLNRQAVTLGEFLAARDYAPPRLDNRRAIVQGHCHHKAIMGLADDEKVLEKLGLDSQVLDSGCCGLAGSFGFEDHKYDVSMKAGERVLLPAVREAPGDTIIIADGFSCREQIAHATSRRALHTAEVLQMAIHGAGVEGGELAESATPGLRPPDLSEPRTIVPALAGAIAGFLLAAMIGRRG